MKPSKPIEFISPKETYTHAVEQAVNEARAWVLNWYNERAKLTNPATGKPFVSEEQLATIHERLANVKVITGGNFDTQLFNSVIRGKVHIQNHTPESFREKLRQAIPTHEEQIRLLQSDKANEVNRAGAYMYGFDESIICLDEKLIQHANLHCPEGDDYRLVGELKQAAIHELTHAATYEIGLDDDITLITDTMRDKHEYWDSTYEIRARLNELRYEHGMTPDQTLTPEQIQQLRQKSVNEDQRTIQKLDQYRQQGISDYDQIPQPIKAYDPSIFDRYTDTQVEQLINEVASTRPIDLLDDEHRGAHPDRMPERQIAYQPPTQKETIQQQRHFGLRI